MEAAGAIGGIFGSCNTNSTIIGQDGQPDCNPPFLSAPTSTQQFVTVTITAYPRVTFAPVTRTLAPEEAKNEIITLIEGGGIVIQLSPSSPAVTLIEKNNFFN